MTANEPSSAAILGAVESSRVRIIAGATSGYEAFREQLSSMPEFRTLQAFGAAEGGRVSIARRTAELAGLEIDRTYRNPFDVAIAAYLLVLEAHPDIYTAFALARAVRAPNTWWTAMACQAVLQFDVSTSQVLSDLVSEPVGTRVSPNYSRLLTTEFVRDPGLFSHGPDYDFEWNPDPSAIYPAAFGRRRILLQLPQGQNESSALSYTSNSNNDRVSIATGEFTRV